MDRNTFDRNYDNIVMNLSIKIAEVQVNLEDTDYPHDDCVFRTELRKLNKRLNAVRAMKESFDKAYEENQKLQAIINKGTDGKKLSEYLEALESAFYYEGAMAAKSEDMRVIMEDFEL